MKIERVILDGGKARNERSTSSPTIVLLVVVHLVLLVPNKGAILITRPGRCVFVCARLNAELTAPCGNVLPFIGLALIGVHCQACHLFEATSNGDVVEGAKDGTRFGTIGSLSRWGGRTDATCDWFSWNAVVSMAFILDRASYCED
jgi:hypothetical protein